MQNNFESTDSQIHISDDFSFESIVSKPHWDKNDNPLDHCNWVLVKFRCKYLVPCTGFAAKEKYRPKIGDRNKFKGVSFLTAGWSWEGVVVGAQVVQEIGHEVSDLVVFQRTPSTALPMRQRTNDSNDRKTQLRRRGNYRESFQNLRKTSFSVLIRRRSPCCKRLYI